MLNPWKVLGVNRASTPEEISKAFKEAMKIAHPDVNNGVVGDTQAPLEAYHILKDKKRTKDFVSKCLLFGHPCIRCDGRGVTYKQKGFTARIATPCGVCSGSGIISKEFVQ